MAKASTPHLQILLFEDHPGAADPVRECLKRTGLRFDSVAVGSLAEGVQALQDGAFDLVLLDLTLELCLLGSAEVDTLQVVAAATGDAVLVVLSAAEDEALGVQALRLGAQDCLVKDGLNGDVLGRSIRYALERAAQVPRGQADALDMKYRAALLRRVFDANVDAMLILTESYEIQLLNPAACKLLEASADSLVGEVFPFEIERGASIDLEIPGPQESLRLVELHSVDLVWEGANALLVTLRDVTLRRQAELGLQREEERLAVTLDVVADAVLTIGRDGEIEHLNSAATALLGVSLQEARGRRAGDVLKLRYPQAGHLIVDPIGLLQATESEAQAAESRLLLLNGDGGDTLVDVALRSISNVDRVEQGCVIVLRAVPQQADEEDFLQAEKLHSISLLAGGIAHDFNNILTAVLGNISMVRLGMQAESSRAKKLVAAEKAVLQATSLAQQLLTFSKGDMPHLEATTLDQLVEDSAQFILRGSNVKCEVHKDAALWAVDADPGQISQVVNNLIINADQAMPGGGVIRLSLTCEHVASRQLPPLAAGDYVCITVEDQGGGIAPEYLKRIFDPYFTTKINGNGLGLASSYAIVKSYNGLMTVDSVVSKGSTFKVYLPKSTEALAAEASAKDPAVEAAVEDPAVEAPAEESGIHLGHGRILVMDDMEAMMLVAGEILQVLGYEVEFSRDGQEAIDAYKKAKEAGHPFDAVVFDLTVPGGMGGEEACRILNEYDPDIIAVASSGYSTSNVMTEFEAAGFKAVVPKPYRIKDMSTVLHRILKS